MHYCNKENKLKLFIMVWIQKYTPFQNTNKKHKLNYWVVILYCMNTFIYWTNAYPSIHLSLFINFIFEQLRVFRDESRELHLTWLHYRTIFIFFFVITCTASSSYTGTHYSAVRHSGHNNSYVRHSVWWAEYTGRRHSATHPQDRVRRCGTGRHGTLEPGTPQSQWHKGLHNLKKKNCD